MTTAHSEGLGFSGGAYELILTATAKPAPPGPAGSISGRAVDAANQTPLPGDVFPFVVVKLDRCDNGNCDSLSLLSTMPTDRNGRFRFDRQSVGARLTEGTYQIIAIGNQNFAGRTDLFSVSAGQQARIGDSPLVECITECLGAPAVQGGSR